MRAERGLFDGPKAIGTGRLGMGGVLVKIPMAAGSMGYLLGALDKSK